METQSAPTTPKKNVHARFEQDIVRKLNDDFNLGVKIPDKSHTPRRRKQLAAQDEVYDRSQKIYHRLHHHYYRGGIEQIFYTFHSEAKVVCRKWIQNPRADPDTFPWSGDPSKATTPDEQYELQTLLLDILEKADPRREPQPATRKNPGTLSRARSGPAAFDPALSVPLEKIAALPSVPPPLGRPVHATSKRQSEEGLEDASTKRVKSGRQVANAIDDVPVRSKPRPSVDVSMSKTGEAQPVTGISSRLPQHASSVFNRSFIVPYNESANTSKASIVSRVFSEQSEEDALLATQDTTQSTIEVNTQEKPNLPPAPQESSQESFAPSSNEVMALHESFFRHETKLEGRRPTSRGTQTTSYSSISGLEEITMPDVPAFPRDGDTLSREPLSVSSRLKHVWPTLPQWLQTAPLAVIWEITRVALHCDANLDDIKMTFSTAWLDHSRLWMDLYNHHALRGKPFPERPSADAWAASLKGFRAGDRIVVLSASLKLNEGNSGPLFSVHLNPLKLEQSCRLSRRFGADRFLEVLIQSLSAWQVPPSLREPGATSQVIHWLSTEPHFLVGRQWRAYFTRDAGHRKPVKDIRLEPDTKLPFRDRMYFFAENGNDFRTVPSPDPFPPKNSGLDDKVKMDVGTMLDWLLQFGHENQQQQPFLKLFSRIQLGLSKTYPAAVLESHQIIERGSDILSPIGNVMNDGIGKMSRNLARRVRDGLGLQDTPSAIQGRIGSAKGMWLVDVKDTGDQDWIETYPSQRKWKCDAIDEEQRTLEVRSHATELRSANLNLQFIPVLEDRAKDKGRMREAIAQCLVSELQEELDSLKSAMKSPLLFRQWVQANSTHHTTRQLLGHIPFIGGLPEENEDIMAFLLDSGFDPAKQKLLQDIAFTLQRAKCDALKKRMNIRVARSAYIYMVVDFWGLLEEGEIHVCFSSKFQSEQFSDTLLHDMDVLVARSPAHFSSDIQKVRAVFKPELHSLKDVVVFSLKGNVALADKLSGGDYDGDMAWVCWDPGIVANFENAAVPPSPDLSEYLKRDATTLAHLSLVHGPERAVTVMIERGFEFNIRGSYLGICTKYKERLCYKRNTVSDDTAIVLSALVGRLVDQGKQGIDFTEESWARLRRDLLGERGELPEPAYRGDHWPEREDAPHIIDHLKFKVAKPTIDRALQDLHRSPEGEAHFWDPDLVKPYEDFQQLAGSSQSCHNVLEGLKNAIVGVRDAWSKAFDDIKDKKEKSGSGKADVLDFPARVNPVYRQWCAIRPAALRANAIMIDTKLVKLLEEEYVADPECSRWALLRASVAFKMHVQRSPRFVWRIAGSSLATIKALVSEGGGGVPVLVVPSMYGALRPNAKFIKLVTARMAGEVGSEYVGDREEREIEGVGEDSEDEAGDD